jgi:tyrosyl-tRNA synthetase
LQKAREHFERTVVNKTPEMEDITEVKLESDLAEMVVKSGILTSKSELRRLVEQGGVYVNDKRYETGLELKVGDLVRVGKRKYLKVVV